MYAVYVLAAILLSVAPMHASAVLAALPPASSTQGVCSRWTSAGEQQSGRASQEVPEGGVAARRSLAPQTVRPAHHEGLAADGDGILLAHAPNAP